jgi:hypothetical protein
MWRTWLRPKCRFLNREHAALAKYLSNNVCSDHGSMYWYWYVRRESYPLMYHINKNGFSSIQSLVVSKWQLNLVRYAQGQCVSIIEWICTKTTPSHSCFQNLLYISIQHLVLKTNGFAFSRPCTTKIYSTSGATYRVRAHNVDFFLKFMPNKKFWFFAVLVDVKKTHKI